MKDILKHLADREQGFVELRHHKRTSNSFVATKGRVDVANHAIVEGVGVRALEDGVWGFAATADCSEKGIAKAISSARRNAEAIAEEKDSGAARIELRDAPLATEDYVSEGYEDLVGLPFSDKLGKVIDTEKALASSSKSMLAATCSYSEYLEEKSIVTSDGAYASMKVAQPEARLSAIAESAGERANTLTAAGVAGGWECLFAHPTLNNWVEETAQRAVDLIKAGTPEGGKKTCILAPSVVGLLCHEAIGHTVEADFVRAGSVAAGKIGKRVGSDLVSLADTGAETIAGYAVGNLPFDDEGVKTETTMIIKDGILTSYLHNRETAAEFDVAPTGNARAWLFRDEPIIRMRNTYLLPGTSTLAAMIADVEDGYLIEGAGGGQADANGEFMFGSGWVWEIKNGKKGRLLKNTTLSGIAFDVLNTVDAVSQEFLWDLGSGHCGKGQPAKVDAGGPYIRCQINIGGAQK